SLISYKDRTATSSVTPPGSASRLAREVGHDAKQVIRIPEEPLGAPPRGDLRKLLLERRDRGCALAVHRDVDEDLEPKADPRRHDRPASRAERKLILGSSRVG